MISLHKSTHSSQMNTVGPAINFLTSFLLLLQKEQRSTSLRVRSSLLAISSNYRRSLLYRNHRAVGTTKTDTLGQCRGCLDPEPMKCTRDKVVA